MSDIWAWCQNARHRECRALQSAGDGTMDHCGCPCHVGWGDDDYERRAEAQDARGEMTHDDE